MKKKLRARNVSLKSIKYIKLHHYLLIIVQSIIINYYGENRIT